MPKTASSKARSNTARAAEPPAGSSGGRTEGPPGPRQLLDRRQIGVVSILALLLSFWQAPGTIAPDTKLDLTADPVGFLSRAAHLWSPDAPMGQIQNQAYGYFFPHGALFALGDLIGLPGWITQRFWWALLLAAGFVGLVRLAEALHVGSFGSRLLAAAVFVTAPRVLTTLGSISSETLPYVLAPWVLVPMVRALDPGRPDRYRLWQAALRSACAVALMGAVNAVATAAATGVAVVWWVFGFVSRDQVRRRLIFGGWWALGLILACLWWLVPLLMLSRLSPPFLDFIESSRVTTEWSSLTEVLRGTSSWTPFVSNERAAGAVLVSETAAVLATGILAAAGLAGLAMRHMPFRRRLIAILVIGVLVMCLGYPGALGSPLAEAYRDFLDGTGAPLRNLHKFEPFVRIPLALGLAHLLARVRVRAPVDATDRGFAAAALVVVAAIAAGGLAWTGGLAPPGSYRAIPGYWQQTAAWLAQQERDQRTPARTLVVPGAPFADQLWGLTRDEPMQALAETPWAVRDAIPLTPPGAIRALDSVQRALAAGRGGPGLAPTLAEQGVGYLVLRTDLEPTSSRSARPLLVAQALHDSPGITPVATFGPPTSPPAAEGFVVDNGLRPDLPAVTVYRVDGDPNTGPRLTPAAGVARVAGGPESLLALNAARARAGLPALGPALLLADARRAGLGDGPGVIATDTPALREVDFGRVDDNASAIRSPDDPRLTKNRVADYPVDGQPPVVAQWVLDGEPGRVRVTTSGSASDATQPGQTVPAAAAASAFDGDPDTAWVSRGLDSAVGQWLAVDLTEPMSQLAVTLTTARAIGPDVTTVLVTTDAGSTVAANLEPGKPTRVVLPSGPTTRVEIRAIETENGRGGNQFALADVELDNAATNLPIGIRQQVLLPDLPTGTRVREWVLGPDLPGRGACVTDGDRVRCAGALPLAPEIPGVFSRTLSVPEATQVRPSVVLRPMAGAALNDLLAVPGAVRADGPSSVTDVRGSAAAAVDGDPATTWIAPEPTDKDSARPTLTVRLPQATEVTGLKLATPDDYPARPTRVTVDLGTGPQRVTVGDDGVLALRPTRTETVKITITATSDLIDINDLGFATPAPAGLSEVTVLSAAGPVSPAPADPARRIVIPCDADPAGPLGLGLTASGRLIRLTVDTTAGALRGGEPILASPCPGAPLSLGAGRQEIAVNPGQAFTVDAVDLSAAPPLAAPSTVAAPVSEWEPTRRTLTVAAADEVQLLSIPESTNPGWHARLDGVELAPIVVDGWQQGWLVPAGMGGTVALTFDLDGAYRWSLLVGLLLVAVLFVAAHWPAARSRPRRTPSGARAGDPDEHAATDDVTAQSGRRTTTTQVAAGFAGFAAAWLLGGWWGLAVAAIAGGLTVGLVRRTRVVVVFGAMALATVLLAAGPWHSGLPYTGHDAGPQWAALFALAFLVAGAVLPLPRREAVAHRVPAGDNASDSG